MSSAIRSEPRYESTAEMLAAAHAAGFVGTTAAQVARAHREGLLPQPVWTHLPGLPGSASLYPQGTAAQFVALCEAQRKSRLFERNGWDLWMQGFAVAEKYWLTPLKDNARLMERSRTELLVPAMGDDDRSSREKEAMVQKIAERPTTGPLIGRAKLTLKVGKFAVLLSRLLEIPAGHFDRVTSETEDCDNPDTRTLLKGVFGFFAPGQQLPEQVVKYVVAPVESFLGELAQQFSGEGICQKLERTTLSGELEVARDQFHTMSRTFGEVAKQFATVAKGQEALLKIVLEPPPLSVDLAARFFLLWMYARETLSLRQLTRDFLQQNPQYEGRGWQQNSHDVSH